MSPGLFLALQLFLHKGLIKTQVGQQEEEEEGRGVGMEQVSDPPGDLASDTPAKGKGGKETSEKRPAKQCWPDRKKKKQKPKKQQTNGPELICICIGHLGNRIKHSLFFRGVQGISVATSVHEHKRINRGNRSILVILFLGINSNIITITYLSPLFPGSHQEKQHRHKIADTSGSAV